MEGPDSRCWDELLPDALGLIFRNLSLKETLTVVPQVCKSWSQVVMGPYCWQEIDIEKWSYDSEPDNIVQMVRMLIARSSGALHKLCVSGLRDEEIYSLIAENGRALHTLRLSRSNLSDSIVEQIAGRLSAITFLDLSYCARVGAPALEIIGNHCRVLSGLCRNMHPLDMNKISMNDEASAIANTMPMLKHLEITYLLIDTNGALQIIKGCPKLEVLDLRGCWDVSLDIKYIKEKFPKLNVIGPDVFDLYEGNYWEECSDFSDAFVDYESSDGMWDDEEPIEGLEVSFYDGFDEDSFYGWPPSP